MQVTIRYFASVREALGHSSETIGTEATTLAELRADLSARSLRHADALAPGKAVRMALDQVMRSGDALLHEGCEVAFFPPVTGG
jgi:sulfur-carrier protein